MIVGSLVHMSFLVAASAMQDPLLPDCTGGNISAWLACRQNLIHALFNASSLPSRSNPDYVVPMPNYAMHGFPGPGDGVGDVSGNSWSNNMTALVWTIETPFITLNSTVYHTLNTSGRAPRNWPQDGPSMPGPAIVPTARGDTVVFYHNGHETNKCTPNYDGVVDHFNQLGYDVFEFFMPLYGCNGNTPYETSSHHEWFEQWELKGDFPLRFFIEPVILSVNYAVNVMGYKHVVLVGLSGGGWTTTVTAAVDPRIKLSIPIAGSVPKWPTTLYPNFVPDLPEVRPAWRCSRPRNSGVRPRSAVPSFCVHTHASRPFVFTGCGGFRAAPGAPVLPDLLVRVHVRARSARGGTISGASAPRSRSLLLPGPAMPNPLETGYQI